MLIDVHAHYGHDYVFDEDDFDDTLLYWCDKCSVDHAIIQPCIPRPYIKDTIEIHDAIYALVKAHGRRFSGMASIDPHFRPEDYERELTRCVKELGFVGVKITPIGHAANPAGQDSMFAYEISRGLNIPVMVHTGAGAPFADPLNIIKPAKAFPDVKFVMAHAGTDALFTAALHVAESCPNVYLEPSWLNIYSLKAAVESIGPARIMFSSDMPMNIPVEIAKYRALTDDPAVLDQLFCRTAIDVYGLGFLLGKGV